MKEILTLLALFISGVVIGQNAPFPKNANEEIEFSEIINSSLNKQNLYANAKEWTAKTFGDYKKVIQFEDESNGKLIIKGLSDVPYKASEPFLTSETISYTITIECKDNKYRYKINDLKVEQTTNILGSKIHPQIGSPEKHLANIKKYTIQYQELQTKIDSLKSIGKSNISKRNSKKLSDEIITFTKKQVEKYEYLENEKKFYVSEFDTIQSLINSLKNAMNTDDDF